MDRALNSKFGKDTIYEIYRGCRLCGAGAGYKMPIVQNVVDLDESGVKLSQKIRECVQIQVHQDDKMPPLICELCVDKVNDFYDFLEMCRQTNRQTRLKLGLPLQTSSSGSELESNNSCILGMTESIDVDDDSDGEPLSMHTSKPILRERHKEKTPPRDLRSKNVKEIKHKNEITSSIARVTRTSSVIKRERASSQSEDDEIPMRVTRTASSQQQQNKPPTQKQETVNRSKSGGKPKPVLKESANERIKIFDDTSFFNGRKRAIESEDRSSAPSKKVRMSPEASRPPTRMSSQKSKLPASWDSRQRSSKNNSHQKSLRAKRSSSPPSSTSSPTPSDTSADIICPICSQVNRTTKGLNNHIRVHVVNYTNNKFACNPCGEWFLNYNETQAHHRQHKYRGLPYRCRRCSAEYTEIDDYDTHLTNGECIPYDVVPDVKCEICWRYFATDNLLIEHKCAGEDGRPGGKCTKCNRTYVLLKNLKIHETVCRHKGKSKLIVDPEIMESLKTVQISLVRCDNLLKEKDREFLNSSYSTQSHGLEDDSMYPYISSVRSLRVKSEPLDDDFDCMVEINDKVKDFLTEEDCIDWDSDVNDNDAEKSVSVVNKRQRVDTLAALALKAVVSQRFLGKVPKKYRKIRVEKMFDSLGEFGVKNIDKLLERLDDVNISAGKEERKASDVDNEDSAIVKSENSVSVNENDERKICEEIKEINSDSVEYNFNGAIKLSNKTDSNNQEDNENVNNSRSETDRSEEVPNSIERNDSDESNNCPEKNVDSDRSKVKEHENSCSNNIEERTESDINKGNTTVELNGHNSKNHDSKVVDETLNEKRSLNNIINMDIDDKKLMDDLDEQIGENKATMEDKRERGPKQTFDHEDQVYTNIGGDGKLDQTPNGQCDKQKITLEDLLVSKEAVGNSSYLDTISEEEYSFDV